MNRSILPAAALAVLACAGVSAASGVAIPARPEQIEFKPLQFDPPSSKDFRRELAGGVPVYLAPSSEFPLVQITFTFKGGAYLDPAEKVGLAEMTGAMIRRGGTTTVTAQDLDENLDYLAAVATTSAGTTVASASLNSLSSNLSESFALFMDMLRNPGFQEDKVKIFRDEQIEGMKQRNDDANSIAGREWPAMLYGWDHFEAREPTKASLESITASDMRQFHEKVFQPGNLIIGVSGDFKPDDMIAMLNKAMEGWARGERMPDPPAPTATVAPGVYYVVKDIPQGKVNVGMRGITRDDPDYFAVLVMNDILGGGGFTSRLMSRIRSDEGLAYGAGSSFSTPVYYPGAFTATYASKNRTVAQALRIVFEEIERVRREPVSAEELETAKASFIETFPRTFESKPAMLNVFINDEWTNRDPDYWKTFRDRIRAVTPADVQRVARERLNAENMAVLVVGNWEEIAQGDPTQTDPKRAVKMGEFFAGKATRLPLRDPMTMQPIE